MTNTENHEPGRVPRLSDHFRKAKEMTPTENKLIRDIGTTRQNLMLLIQGVRLDKISTHDAADALDQIAREARGLAEGLRNVSPIFEQRFSVNAAGELVVSTASDKPDQPDTATSSEV